MISLTPSISPPSQASGGQVKAVQARRAADQAEAYARELRIEAIEAHREAQRTRKNADVLSAEQIQPRLGLSVISEASTSKPQPVMNVRGELTGRIINVTA